jgi:hypothetical protein
MSKVTTKRSAPVSARETDREARDAANVAQSKPNYSEPETGDEAEDTDPRYADICQEPYEEEQRILRALEQAADVVSRKALDAGANPFAGVHQVFILVRLAAEAAAAKAAGYETWAAFEAAQAARMIDVAA